MTNAEWVLYLDADERLDHQLVSAINKVKESNKFRCAIHYQAYFQCLWKTVQTWCFAADRVARLFPRGKVLWVNRVHERPESDLPKFKLNGNIIHYTYSGWTQWLRKFEQYTTIWANDAYKKGKRTSPFGIVSHANFAFIQMAFHRLGLLDGFMGFLMCCNHFFYTMIKYLKLYELQRGKTNEDSYFGEYC
jgi:hypothetical protein